MKNKLKRAVSALMVAGVLATSTVPALAANAGGGKWDYGTKVVGLNKKLVYSNYYHGTKKHKSSVSIGTTYISSGWVGKGNTSYASATGSWTAQTQANYDYK
ncbi:MAG: lactococcin 972 family bacteriocin [Lachnospiraceae bacterium]|nr:lactococcin 972 family bacteriocin [Lachnospiraceae bacterium]